MDIRSVYRPLRPTFLAVFFLSPLTGCGTTRIQVPEGRVVRLLEEEEPASVVEERRLWFWLWGNAAINDDSPVPEIEAYDLEEIRVTSKQTLLDTMINVVGGAASIVCRTIVVEGNPREDR